MSSSKSSQNAQEVKERANLTPDERSEVYEFLDDLRESGVTNMFGAGSYVIEELGWDRKNASAAVADWMRTFEDRHPR